MRNCLPKSLVAWIASVILMTLMTSASAAEPPPQQQKINELMRLLQDPEIQSWVADQKQTATGPARPRDANLSSWEAATRQRINGVIASIPRIPVEIAAAANRTAQDAKSHGYPPFVIILIGFVGIGLLGEQLFSLIQPLARTSTAGRLAPVAVFSVIMVVAFFAVDWPPMARTVLLVYVSAAVAYRWGTTVIALVAPSPERRWRLRMFLAALILGVGSSLLGPSLLIDASVLSAITYCFSLVLLAMAIDIAWQHRSSRGRLAVTLFIIAIWVVWCLGLGGIFWLSVYSLVLPPLLKSVGDLAARTFPFDESSVQQVLVVRGGRAFVVLGAVVWLALVWRFNLNSVIHTDPTVAAISYGLLKSVIVVLAADFVRHLARSWIDRKLLTLSDGSVLTPSDAARNSRVRTLLPLFRNALAVVVVVMTVLIVLGQLGVEIGPLLAGAGIFGVALGFGSQTLVKDVISGIFYMFDDAFRIGEYIQAKGYRGTVEGFSLRSVKLRHHRGPVFTVPFGELGAVENMSRDWGVVKFRISVGYTTDVEKARKLTKKIGVALAEDPEIGPLFLEPLKMKGVEEFGDYGMVLSFGMMLRPSPMQSFVRRRANLLLREAFMSNGIEFATPSVQVGSDDKSGAAAAATATAISQQAKLKAEPDPAQ